MRRVADTSLLVTLCSELITFGWDRSEAGRRRAIRRACDREASDGPSTERSQGPSDGRGRPTEADGRCAVDNPRARSGRGRPRVAGRIEGRSGRGDMALNHHERPVLPGRPARARHARGATPTPAAGGRAEVAAGPDAGARPGRPAQGAAAPLAPRARPRHRVAAVGGRGGLEGRAAAQVHGLGPDRGQDAIARPAGRDQPGADRLPDLPVDPARPGQEPARPRRRAGAAGGRRAGDGPRRRPTRSTGSKSSSRPSSRPVRS